MTRFPADEWTLNLYQALAHETARPDQPHDQALDNAALGLAGEAGEAANHVKKYLYHGHPLDRDYLVKELGDCLWYIARMAAVLDVELGVVAFWNIDKLRRRYPGGFSEEASQARPAEAE